jgi:3-hydroxyacyl-[acyl-carrier-protein] dehydratase
MPGVLQIEALAQAAGILGIETLELAGTGKLVYLHGDRERQVPRPREPGCLLDLNVEFTQKRSRVYKFKGVASVEGKTTCECEFTA